MLNQLKPDFSNDPTSLNHPLLADNVLSHLASDSPLVYSISAKTLAAAVDHHYSSFLPDVHKLFPWLHGLHELNMHQRAFLDPSRKIKERRYTSDPNIVISVQDLDASTSQVPSGIRGLLLVKVGSKAPEGTLIGTAYPDEILSCKEHVDTDDFSFEDSMDIDDSKNNKNSEKGEQTLLPPSAFNPSFLNLDPESGISLRNFQIQVAKWATVSDIILYLSDEKERENLMAFAQLISEAQAAFRKFHPHLPQYITCIVKDEINEFLKEAPHIIAMPPNSISFDENDLRLKNWDSNFLFHESVEMSMMSSASIIGNKSKNGGAVWLGNSADVDGHAQLVYEYLSAENLSTAEVQQAQEVLLSRNWTLYVRCAAQNQFPSFSLLDQYIREALSDDLDSNEKAPSYSALGNTWSGAMIDFPSSGTVSPYPNSEEDLYAIVNMCKLLYVRSQALHKGHGAGTLIFCNDGYTETSLLALAYIVYSTGVTASQAWADLHVKYNRPFFSFNIDSLAITTLQPILLKYSPAIAGSAYDEDYGAIYNHGDLSLLSTANSWDDREEWFEKMDGSFPSRILPHMYLGSLVHANNPEMLQKIGIKRIISVGEYLTWAKYDNLNIDEDGNIMRGEDITTQVYLNPYPGITKIMHVDNIQDDGVDSLTDCLSKCIDFLDEGYRLNEPTLVHCRVGVSRSATVCIAEVMKRLGVGLARAYLFVRVRRLNVIIQPHLRFMFELVKWEEQHRRSGKGWLREVDWPILCREIAVMNRAYIPG